MTGAIAVRKATAADLDFLAEMMVEAANWDGTRGTTRASVEGDPKSWRYLEGWQRTTDFGVIAEEGTVPIGAAWARFGSDKDAGYGFVGDDIPELTIAVSRKARGRGVGRMLLLALVDSASEFGLPGISLSVEDGNVAARSLYDSVGFLPVGRNGGSDTMLLTLSEPVRVTQPRGTAMRAPRKWLGPRGGWWIFLGMTAFWLFNVLFDQFVEHSVGLSPNSLVLGGFGMTAALTYTLAYRLKPSDGISVVRLILAFLLGGLLATELAVIIEAPLVVVVLRSNPNATLISRSLAGVIEEACKILAVVIAARGLTTRTARSGLFLGGAVGLGFAAFEDMRYASAALTDTLVGHSPLLSIITTTFGRDLIGPLEHPVMTALLASVLFAATRDGRFRITWRVVVAYLAISAVHSLIDTLPTLLVPAVGSQDAANGLGAALDVLIALASGVVWLVYSRRLNRRLLAERTAPVLTSAEPPGA